MKIIHTSILFILLISKTLQKTITLKSIIQQRNAKNYPISNSRLLQPENNTDTSKIHPKAIQKTRFFNIFKKDCETEVCTFEEILAQTKSKKQAKRKLSRYTNQCKFNPCDSEGTQACIQSWNNRRCICNDLSFGENCEKDKNECLADDNICGGTSICENLKGEKPGYRCVCKNDENYNEQEKKCENKISSRRNIGGEKTFTEATPFYGFTETAEITYPADILEKVTENPPKNGWFNIKNNLKYTGIFKFDVTFKEDCPIHFKKEDADYYKLAYSEILKESLESQMQALDTIFPEMYCDNTGLEPEFKFTVWYYFENGAPIEKMDGDLIERMAEIYKEQIVALSPSEIKLMNEDDVDIEHVWCDECA